MPQVWCVFIGLGHDASHYCHDCGQCHCPTRFGLPKYASDKSAILNKPDLKFFVSNKTAALYRQALATAGAVDNLASGTEGLVGTGYNAQVTNQAFGQLNFLGIAIAECPGMFDDAIVLAQSENLVVGSNLMTDFSSVQYIPVFQYDGSDNVRVVMQFGLGTVAGNRRRRHRW